MPRTAGFTMLAAGDDVLRQRNEELTAAALRLRTAALEDGERVILLRGAPGSSWPSSAPHSGAWGPGVWYAIIPCANANRRAARIHRDFPGIEAKPTDLELLVIGPHDMILRLITTGPAWCRARARRRLSESRRSALAQSGAATRFATASDTALEKRSGR